ncbi:Hsp20/alpha crystallin family protein [Bacillus massiliigorillae]|uniref:Hsp20/alpha crystallin family protein n=1 Tax=Bacillus massiliigorillae TaxID=1243664 RepID=UPI0003A5AB30|nr:Hsp20/alpha crystallin family protein [Bacillus massiliigorillae]
MSTDKKMNHLPSRRNRNDTFSDFISNIDQLFSGKPIGGALQSMDSFFHNSTMNRSFPIEMTEEHDSYIVRAKLAGIKQQQINIEAYNQSLMITVHNYEQSHQHDKNGKTLSQKQAFQTVSRSVTFVKPINDQGIIAQHNDGLLEVVVPKIKGKEVKFINAK